MTRYSENDDMKNGSRKRCAEDEKTDNDGAKRVRISTGSKTNNQGTKYWETGRAKILRKEEDDL